MTATHRAYEQIRERIIDGRLPRGTRIREGEMSTLLQLSRTPVREALKLLSAEGFLTSEPNKGVTVATWSEERVADTYTVRATLEGLAASLAAGRATPDLVSSLHHLCDRMDDLLRRPGKPPLVEVTQLNGKFHKAVVDASGNAVLSELVHRLSQVPAHRTFETYSPDDLRRSFTQHRELALAIEAKDFLGAEVTMKNHILSARTRWSQGRRGEAAPD